MLRIFSVVKLLATIPKTAVTNISVSSAVQRFAKTHLLQPVLPSIQPACGFKIKGRLKRRCKSCYFVVRDERLYVICPKFPRHKQMAMKPKPLNTYILTHASQSRVRPW